MAENREFQIKKGKDLKKKYPTKTIYI